jgi:hemoglobin
MDILNALPPHDPESRDGVPIWTPPGGPPQTDRIPASVYETMGEENITRFTHAFYTRLGQSGIAGMFPSSEKNLMRAADKSAAMFTFLFGGPHLYQQRYGRPMMRARHLPFVIDEPARQEWLRCYRETLDEAPAKYAMPAEHVEAVWKFVVDFSSWMVNAQTPSQPE